MIIGWRGLTFQERTTTAQVISYREITNLAADRVAKRLRGAPEGQAEPGPDNHCSFSLAKAIRSAILINTQFFITL
jgi:hypothetical protein